MVTLKDIAAEAGVSITTVSNVVHNRKSRVSPERVKKIWEIIEHCIRLDANERYTEKELMQELLRLEEGKQR